MLTIEKLRAYGADVESGLRRCVNDEVFYIRMVRTSLNDEHYNKLKEEMESGALNRALDTVVALQGMTGNLALNPIYEPLCALSKRLHDHVGEDEVMHLAEQVLQQYSNLRALDEA